VASATQFTILHTNDWQSRLLGFGPNANYSPGVTGDDDTVGGVARLATLLKQRRTAAERSGPVLLLDGGDITMGTLFHTVTRETGAELQLMHRLGYDAVTLGNHEFDFRPEGLAQMIRSAQEGEGSPPIVCTNLAFDPSDPRDDGLEALWAEEAIQPWMIVERGGVRFGLFGLMGADAYEVIGQAEPVVASDPVVVARETARSLRQDHGADVVILLSHSGVLKQDDGTWGGEEVDFATEVPEIDIIVGGHSHTPLHEPILIDGRPIVQAGSEIQFMGELVMDRDEDGTVSMVSYTLHPVDDTIPGDPETTAFVQGIQDTVTAQVLDPRGYAFDQALAESPALLGRSFDEHVLGNHVTDALRVAAGSDVAFTGNGTIRDEIRPGVQWVSDLFRISPLGIGTVDDSPGYGLIKMWVTGEDLKSAFEFLLVGYQLKGPSYFPRISGAQVTYNNRRVIFDRVSQIALGDDEQGYTPIDIQEDRLYSVAATSYVASFMPTVSEATFGLLDVTPRNADGSPVTDMDTMLVDGDPTQPGVQEIKAYRAMLDHLSSFQDTDQDGIANIPIAGLISENRLLRSDSLAPSALLADATWKMYAAMLCPLGALGLVGLLIRTVLRRRARKPGQ
jgi:5'-nucleotidase